MQGITSQQAARAAAIVLGLLALRYAIFFLVSPASASNALLISWFGVLSYSLFYWTYGQAEDRRPVPLWTGALLAIGLGVVPNLLAQSTGITLLTMFGPLGQVLSISGFATSLVSIPFFLCLGGKLRQFRLGMLAKAMLVLGVVNAIDNVTDLFTVFRLTFNGTYGYNWSRNPWNTLLDWTQTPLICASIAAQLLFYWTLVRKPGGSAQSIFSAGSGDE